MSRPLRTSSSQSGARWGLRSRELRLPAIDLSGASELLSSWPSTRTSRSHASRSFPRRVRLRSAITTRWWGRPPSRNGLRRIPQRPEPAGDARVSRRAGSPSRQSASESDFVGVTAEDVFGGFVEEELTGVVGEAEFAVGVEGEDRAIDFRHHGAEGGGGFQGVEALVLKRVAQGIDFEQDVTQRFVASSAAGANSKVTFAQGGE